MLIELALLICHRSLQLAPPIHTTSPYATSLLSSWAEGLLEDQRFIHARALVPINGRHLGYITFESCAYCTILLFTIVVVSQRESVKKRPLGAVYCRLFSNRVTYGEKHNLSPNHYWRTVEEHKHKLTWACNTL